MKQKTVKLEPAVGKQFEEFCREHEFSQKYVATRAIEMFIDQYGGRGGENSG